MTDETFTYVRLEISYLINIKKKIVPNKKKRICFGHLNYH